MTHASVFSGIGGPEVAAAMLGWKNLFHCEINPFGRRVLQYWFPESESYEDVTKTDFTKWRGKVDVLSGGFPCQPFSYAGKRRGTQDDRFLWPHMLRVIQEVRPTWVVGENVNGIRTDVESVLPVEVGSEADLFSEDNRVYRYRQICPFTIEQICRNFESVGYSVQPYVIPACAVGAPHRRDRVFFVAHHNDAGTENLRQGGKDTLRELGAFANAYCGGGREIHEHLQSQFANGNEPVSLGRIRNAADTNGTGLQESVSDRREAEQEKERTGLDNRTERLDSGNAADTESESAARHKSGQREAGSKKQGKLGGGRCKNGSDEKTSDTDCTGLERFDNTRRGEGRERMQVRRDLAGYIKQGMRPGERWESFPTVSPVHRGNDGIPIRLDNLSIPFGKWRTESIKAYGNAIVPQVMYEIFRAMQEVENNEFNNDSK